MMGYQYENYEMASGFVWLKTINLLREKVLSLGSEFVGEMLGCDNSSFVENLPPIEAINVASDIGFINKLGKLKLKQCNELMQYYTSSDVDSEEMPEDDAKNILRTCIQYILGQDNSNLKLNYNDFRNRLKLEVVGQDEEEMNILFNSPYFYQRTTLRTLMNLLKHTKGAELENVIANLYTIVPKIW
ncbi:hypothetical protein [Tepidibacter mesophilus]|uniref:hypothetical protein n=1 Tax=Tepidibacter mesophilus TaxID=655607 RepID=UPI000C075F80|nr:hypothetical protein [Tepidibacter mesophilus]